MATKDNMSKKIYPNEIMPYKEREDLKEKGRELLKHAHSTTEQARIHLNFIILAHYWRAVEQLYNQSGVGRKLKKIYGKEYYPGVDLDIDTYTRHWMAANADVPGPDVYQELIKIYNPVQSKYMRKGYTVYSFDD